jgi:hypothetical protein
MRVTYKHALWLLAALPLLQGCEHKKVQVAQTPALPPIVDTPPPKPATVSPADLPPPVIGNPQPADTKETAKAPEPPKKPVRHPKKPATTPSTEAKPVQEAANATSPASPSGTQPAESVPAIGQLSGGASGDVKNETEESINATEKGLNGITRPLSSSEVKTAAQIREFLKQAREAMATGDADGAHTLVSKAKVLLAELNQ